MIQMDVYRELAGIVGDEFATREPAVLDSYVWQSLPGEDPDIWLQRPAAVVLPASTEEVQEVVRACSRNDLRCAAFATGWGAFSAPTSDDVVQLDLSRMNRIIAIDTERKVAIVEPGACSAQLQVEAMKVGLNIHVPPSGPCGSPLSVILPIPGNESDEVRLSGVADDLVATECVLPDGEILDLGDAGEMPCSMQGQAVITKGMVRLYDWPGPAEIEVKGLLFDAELEVPDSIRFYLCFFPDAASETKASDAFEAGHICYLANYAAFGSLLYFLAPNLFESVAETEVLGGLVRKVLGNACTIMLASDSPDGFERQEAALRDIVERTQGVVVETREAPRVTALLLASYLRSAAVPRAGRGWGTSSTFLDRLEVESS